MKIIKVEKCEECPYFAHITTNDYGLLAKCEKDGRTYLVALDTTMMPFCPLPDEEGEKEGVGIGRMGFNKITSLEE